MLADGLGVVRNGQHWLELMGDCPQMVEAACKPPYAVPTMADVVAARGANGLVVADLFSGCGGSCLGWEMAGYDVRYGCEFVASAAESWRRNHAGHLDFRDVRQVKPSDVLGACGVAEGGLDVLSGSPPCNPFSTAGRRDKNWGKVKAYREGRRQRDDDLFLEFARLLGGTRPRAFVAENVKGLVMGRAKGYFLIIMRALQACGYDVACRVLDAQWLGVPQTRARAIFVGLRSDLAAGAAPPFPAPLPYRYTVADACPWLASAEHHAGGYGCKEGAIAGPMPAITATQCRVFVEDATLSREPHGYFPGIDISRFAIGAEADKLAPGEKSGKYLNLVRAHPDEPCPAITATAGCASAAVVLPPYGRRKMTILECKRVCSFPDDFELAGSYAQQWSCLGMSVPPLMMRAVAAALRDGFFARLPRGA